MFVIRLGINFERRNTGDKPVKFMNKTQTNIKKICVAGILIALGVVFSTFSIPVGASKCFPIQHMVNVLAGTILGPAYGVGMAFVTSLFRNIIGTGSLLAFPGSMVGALLCGLLFKYTKKVSLAFLGEIIGTGILGALAAFPIATLVMGKAEVALFAYVIPFSISTVGGALIAVVIYKALEKTGVLKSFRTFCETGGRVRARKKGEV